MTPYKEDIFHALKEALAQATPQQIELLLRDIASGAFEQTAQTRAGINDDRSNVFEINDPTYQRRTDAADDVASRLVARRVGYSA